jgi:hypothetical protein
MATMDNDAKICYDRIICNLAMIISHYYGLSNITTKTQATTLQKMRYRLRTALGDSKRYYKHSEETPIHGTGQGSCSSPCIWLFISSILMDFLAELRGGVVMKAVTATMIQQWIDGFVDDTSLFSNLPQDQTNPNDIKLLHEKLQRDMILWRELLEASGGKLALEKCFYCCLSWRFDNKGRPYPVPMEDQRRLSPPISIPDGKGQEITIVKKGLNEWHQTLGCQKTIDGNDKNHAALIQGRSNNFGYAVKNGGLNRIKSTLAYNQMYISSIIYALPARLLPERTMCNIQRYALSKFLSEMGYDRSTLRAILFGPYEIGGYGICHLYTKMLGMKLDMLISHV